MKRLLKKSHSQQAAFTLIEVIVVILISAILAAYLVSFMGTAVIRSSEPVLAVQNLATSEGTVERIAADYVSYLISGQPNWTNLSTCLDRNGVVYSGASCSSQTVGSKTAIQVTVTSGTQTMVTYLFP